MSEEWSRKKAFLFDLDGCLYYGDVIAPGAIMLLEQLRADGKQIRFVTNNSRQQGTEIASKLRAMGLMALPDDVITATDCVGLYLMEAYGKATVKVAGSTGLQDAIEAAGHCVIPIGSDKKADVVVIGRDTEFHYETLSGIVQAIDRGAIPVSANPDTFHPGINGVKVPETGSLCAAVEAIFGKEIAYVGKPANFMFRHALRGMDAIPEEAVMVGDNLNTDIAGGAVAGLTTVWVKGHAGGIQGDTTHKNQIQPDFIFKDINEFYEQYCLNSEEE